MARDAGAASRRQEASAGTPATTIRRGLGEVGVGPPGDGDGEGGPTPHRPLQKPPPMEHREPHGPRLQSDYLIASVAHMCAGMENGTSPQRRNGGSTACHGLHATSPFSPMRHTRDAPSIARRSHGRAGRARRLPWSNAASAFAPPSAFVPPGVPGQFRDQRDGLRGVGGGMYARIELRVPVTP